jgi:hypothetical protein
MRPSLVRQSLPVVVALGVILGAGAVQGVWINRWGSPFDQARIAATLRAVPTSLGDGEWEAVPTLMEGGDAAGVDRPLDAVSLQIGRIDAYLSRVYKSRSTGAEVAILLVCGQPGPISLHPPTICFTSAGAVQTASVDAGSFAYGAEGEALKYFTTDFARPDGAHEETRVLWSWKGSGPWLAPSMPRWSFGSEALLGKLYVVRNAAKLEPVRDGQAVDASTGELLKLLLPELDKAMRTLPTCRVGA